MIIDDELAQVAQLRGQGMGRHKIADALGKSHSWVQRRIEKLDLDPAIADSMTAVGTGLVPALAWAKTKNPDGTSYSILLKPAQEATQNILDRIATAFDGIPSVAVPPPVPKLAHAPAPVERIAWFAVIAVPGVKAVPPVAVSRQNGSGATICIENFSTLPVTSPPSSPET